MNKRAVLKRLALGMSAAALALSIGPAPSLARTAAQPAGQTQRPNIVVILMDDMGFSDVGAYGSEIPTPNLDALARNGLRFTQFYNSARCSPSRAALLTGAHPHQTGMGHLEAIRQPQTMGLHGKLENRVVTIAEVLKPAGYLTAMAGKWHLGMTYGVNPWDRGFDRNFTSPIGELYFRNQPQNFAKTVYIGKREVAANSDEVGKGDWYSSDLFVDWGLKFADEARAQNKPFFLYLPLVAPHFPIMAPDTDVARFKGKYMAGWDALSRARFARQKASGLVAADAKLPPPLAGTYDWNKLTREDKERFDTIMAVYAASIARVDKAVGTLVAELKERGQFDNTLILFMSDNGGNAEAGPDGRMRGEDPGSARSNVFVGMNWATMQNTPLQSFKHFMEEGGISTPLIAHWPRGIASRAKGTSVAAPSHLIDIMPTLVGVSGAAYPARFAGQAIVPMQGRSLAPAFAGRTLTRSQPLFWEHEGNRAVRDGRWKLVARFGRPWRLYDIQHDRGEQTDLATTQPRRVQAMARQWDEWAARSSVDPWTEAYDPYIRGRPRQPWGDAELAERSYATRGTEQ